VTFNGQRPPEIDFFMNSLDLDPQETQEWMESLDSVTASDGAERARYLLAKLFYRAQQTGITVDLNGARPYSNTIPVEAQPAYPGDLEIESRIRSLVRWNALAMVVRANQQHAELGGHIASFASAADLFEVGFNHFFRAPSADHDGDLVYFQAHSAPGIYARAFLEGRLTEENLERYRREVDGRGLCSYPHPRLMPEFWQFPSASMGLAPINAIYQARFMRYLHDRNILKTEGRKVWAFIGDGEMDEPEALGALSLAARERLDNLIFVINCNLQRLDGPVRGNGSIIRELETLFAGAGWNVIKLLWGSSWDELFARDREGLILKRMEETVDGEYQSYKAKDGSYGRRRFFGKSPELLALVADLSDEEISRLERGGHDPVKIHAAYTAALGHRGRPTVILAKTIKGYGMGGAGQAQNTAHQQKKLGIESLREFRDHFRLPFSDRQLSELPFYRPAEDSPEILYLKQRRTELGGFLPARREAATPLEIPPLEAFRNFLGRIDREISTTMAFVQMLRMLLKDPQIGSHIVPIVPDEARTFGMNSLFPQVGIYSSVGQLYEPEDASQLLYYREDKSGQILEEGITEAGAISSWLAAATAYSNHEIQMIPFYIFYSMFGFQRIGDFAWAAGDMRARGFLLGATSGRTTLSGEGLQHQDGHSHLLASTIPNCVSYDPAFTGELAVIIQDGLRRMYVEQENIFYYITLMNENYLHPELTAGASAGIVKGMYLLRRGSAEGDQCGCQLLGSGAILREVLAAAELLDADFGLRADVWSVTSFTELRREGMKTQRWNLLHPEAVQQRSYVETCLEGRPGPVIAASDYLKAYAEQIRPWIGRRYETLGTDGFGRSDTRKKLREFFEVDRHSIVVAALKSMADEELIPVATVSEAIRKYGINPERMAPWEL
jgi:pyruvate dehydrogenase E1 component